MNVTLIDMDGHEVNVVIKDDKFKGLLRYVKKSERNITDKDGDILDTYYVTDIRMRLWGDIEYTDRPTYLNEEAIDAINNSDFDIEYLYEVIANGEDIPPKMVLSCEREELLKEKGMEMCDPILWGGARLGAGRKKKDTKQMTCRMPPAAIKKLKKLAEDDNKLVGEYICDKLGLI